MITTVFVILLEFRDWDECVGYATEHRIEKPLLMCEKYEVEPRWTVRPKARPWKDGEKQ